MNSTALLLALGSGLAASFTPMVFQKQGAAAGRQVGIQFWSSVITAVVAGGIALACGLPLGGGAHLGACVVASLFLAVNGFAYLSVVAHRGPVSISWAVVYLSAVAVAAMGWTILGEPILVLQIPGLILFMACLAVMALATHRSRKLRGLVQPIRKGFGLWLAVSLLAGALGGFGMKAKDFFEPAGDDMGFIMVRGALTALVMAGVAAASRERPVCDRRTLALSALAAALWFASFFLLLKGLKLGDTSAIFPVQAGAAVALGTLWALLRGERPSRLVYLGVILAVAAIILINLGGPVLWPGRGTAAP